MTRVGGVLGQKLRYDTILTTSQGGLGSGRDIHNFVDSFNGSFLTKSSSDLHLSFPSLNLLSGRRANLILIPPSLSLLSHCNLYESWCSIDRDFNFSTV